MQVSDEQLEELMRDGLIEGLLDEDAALYEVMSTEALLDMFKYRVCGLKKVDGNWIKPEGDDDAN